MKRVVLLLGILLVGAMLFACAQKSVPMEKPTLPELLTQEAQTTGKEPWEVEWEKTLTEAKKEGKVVIYTTWRPEARKALSEVFKNKFGMDLEFTVGRGGELVEKILREKRAGINNVDFYAGGATSMVTQLKPADVFDPFEHSLILPEIKDPQVWWLGQLPFIDKARFIFYTTAHPGGSEVVSFNAEMVKKDEIKYWRDLLNPRWKGLIVMDDPSIAGRGNLTFSVTAEFIGLDFWREIVNQKPVIIRDQRLQVEWIARGKYALAISALNELVNEYRKAGAPIDALNLMDEVPYITTASSNISIIQKSPHPFATKVFINWFLNREGQLLFTKETDWHSTRINIPSDHLSTFRVRKPGVKYFNSEDEEFLKKRKNVYEKFAMEVFGPLLK